MIIILTQLLTTNRAIMKNSILSRLASIAFVSLLFTATIGCQEDEAQRTGTSNDAAQTLRTTSDGNCAEDCIEDQNYFIDTQQTIVRWGGPNQNNNSKTVDIEYYNTETHFILRVKSTNGWSDLVINGVSSWTNGPVAANTWGTYSYPLDQGWEACDLEDFSLSVSGNGPPAQFMVTYNLFGVCSGCETEFTGDAVSCGTDREANYTFTAETDMSYIKIQGGLTNFTGADAVVTVTGGNLTQSQSTPGGSSNRIIKVEGSVSACETITINIKWNSTNPGGTITGDWSVKDANGVEVAPSIPDLVCD